MLLSDDIYIFDMDGVLCDSQQPMPQELRDVWDKWVRDKRAFLVTGGTYERVICQLPWDIILSFEAIFTESGNCMRQFIDGGERIRYEKTHHFSERLVRLLENFAEDVSRYPFRTYDCIQTRNSMLNYSLIGPDNKRKRERKEYLEYEDIAQERDAIINTLSEEFPQYEFRKSTVSIDVFPKGWHKGQVLEHLIWDGDVYFFGDKVHEGGNDYDLKKEVDKVKGKTYKINNWKKTMRIIGDA